MKKYIFSIMLIALSWQCIGQIVINELDCDSPGIDDKEFVELKSDTPNTSLNGYVLVFFNGSTSGADSSYFTLDLDGFTTDANGLLLIGSDSVEPFPQYLIAANVIQNGADAVAIYLGDETDFSEGTLATQTNLIDALVYDTSDADDTELMALLGVTEQINEGSSNNINSIQRNNDGSYFVGTPTPRLLNDGSGDIFNAITISTSQTQYNEDAIFDIVFTAQQNVTSDFEFSFTLDNYGFTTDDFTGNTTITIPSGQNTVSTTITLIDDTLDEGDEEPLIKFSNLQWPFVPNNNFLKLRVVDNDFTMAAFGTPINSTFGIVSSTQPDGYYNSLDGFADVALRQALQNIIADPNVVRAQTYTDCIEILKEADQNPENSNQVWLVYLEQGRAKLDFQTTSVNTGTWNREHTFPRSRAGYYSIEEDEIADGVDVFWTTKADSLRHGNSDAHALRAVDGPENSSRGNQFYGEYNGPSGTLGGFKGDVARGVFYLAVRYNGLEIVNGFPDGMVGQFGDLQTLLDWHRNDPPDDYEMNRNNIIYNWQFNRNPFIDQPDLIEYIWGDMVGETWEQNLSVEEAQELRVSLYPNPTSGRLFIKGINTETKIEVFSVDGRQLMSQVIDSNSFIDLNYTSGLYLVKITSENRSVIKKILIN
ncbi:endonuclease [Xanthomarina spongicola]|uniref:Putative secreted protein (Por secretion system target) n=1 Tax=Xanthomarina spongicola TaxID=570520 RepID=A0A316DKV4_9FLAO|nr:endonuclease [Xanthomarina spongicola]PWK18306.1 putative secreted protein (Por secretion system target) [Xanthomarina spongicola]